MVLNILNIPKSKIKINSLVNKKDGQILACQIIICVKLVAVINVLYVN